jgi:hypothetical protein
MDRVEASCPVMKGLRSYMNVTSSYGVWGRTCDYTPRPSASLSQMQKPTYITPDLDDQRLGTSFPPTDLPSLLLLSNKSFPPSFPTLNPSAGTSI